MIEVGKKQPPREAESQKGPKQPQIMQTRSTTKGERSVDHQTIALVWAPCMELGGAPLLSDASIQDFQWGTTGYVVDTMEQSLLLPMDMADLRSMKEHEVFLGLKRDLAMVSKFLSLVKFSSSNFFFFFLTVFLFLSRSSK